MADMADIIEQSLREPLEDRGTLIRGTLLVMSMILIIPILTLYGYVLRTIKYSAEQKGVPEVTDFVELTTDGLKLFILLIPVMLFSIVPLIVVSFANSDALTLIVILVYQLFSLAIGYLAMAMLMRYAVEGGWRSVYSMDTLNMAFSKDYLIYFVIYVIVYMMLYIAVMIIWLLSFITIIGWVVVIPLTIFYMMAWMGVYFGKVYRELD